MYPRSASRGEKLFLSGPSYSKGLSSAICSTCYKNLLTYPCALIFYSLLMNEDRYPVNFYLYFYCKIILPLANLQIKSIIIKV